MNYPDKMKISIITAVINGAATIESCITSVLAQTYEDIEHIIIDGGSCDGTLGIISKYKDKIAKVISETDNGMYYALNKGIKLASGDIIGILHSDDFYAHNRIIENVADVFKRENVDSCFGDLQYVSEKNPAKIVRYWKALPCANEKFKYGWMLPHPAFFVKKWVYEKFGCFNTDFKIAADYELMLRLLVKYGTSTYYIPELIVKMRMGGLSNKNLINLFIKSYEDYKAWKVNNLKIGTFTILLKNLVKIPQFFRRI